MADRNPLGLLQARARRLAGSAQRRLPVPVRRALVAARGYPSPLLVDRLPGRSVVVLAPHPDDELIGCGGAALKHLDAGQRVTVVLVTSGEATPGLDHLDPADRAPHREAEAHRALDAVGLGEGLRFLRAPDTGAGLDPGLPGRLAAALDELRPDLVYAPWPVDANVDHRSTTDVLAAWTATAAHPPDRVALYEVWTPLAPTHLVEVTDELPRKLEALAHYECALATVDYLHTATGLAAYRSAMALGGRGHAEAFCVLPPEGLRQLVAELAAPA